MHTESGMSRRRFIVSTGSTAIGALFVPRPSYGAIEAPLSSDFEWSSGGMTFHFSQSADRLHQRICLPSHADQPSEKVRRSYGPEVALLCTGAVSPDSGTKLSGGNPGRTLKFIRQTQTNDPKGSTLVLEYVSEDFNLNVRSVYQGFAGLPTVRRHVEVTNVGKEPVGIEYLGSAMLHGLAEPQHFEHEIQLWLAYNSWMSEGQWHSLKPSELGLIENRRCSWSQASAQSIGSWSTEKYLPMGIVENKRLGVSWFWQIEHNGSWYWEVSNLSEGDPYATDVYAYLGGPDQLHSQAWKNLQPGASYRSVPVALGCVMGGFTEAVQTLTRYRQRVCVPTAPAGRNSCPVIFNDYMNCLWGDPTEAKELQLIDAAAEAGCEYYVIDAGWYAEKGEDWSKTVGAWEPSKTRWPNGLSVVIDRIRQKGMVPGLWLEPEVAGVQSALAAKPDSWFFMRHGKRVAKNGRLMLDFRNPEVRAYLDATIQRLVTDYGIGYIKMDYNTDTLEGTDQNADSVGQGLLEHNRFVLSWLDGVRTRHPDLVLENCGSGGGRMDYAMLSHTHLQSCTDQEDYLRLPAIATGAAAGVAPSQLALWSYPRADADADAASFNMVTALLLRVHQSGDLAQLKPGAMQQVKNAIHIYKNEIRRTISDSVPFFPLGMPDVTDRLAPLALGMKNDRGSRIAVWCLDGTRDVRLPIAGKPRILFPIDLGIHLDIQEQSCTVHFPRARMGCILVL